MSFSPSPSPSPPPPPPPPPPGSPPPPPNPADSPSANYFFGFVITFIVLLLLFVGCGIGSWRRFRVGGAAWGRQFHYLDDGPMGGRKRRRKVRPVFLETWTQPAALTHLAVALAASGKGKWAGVQPMSVTFVWSRSKLRMCPHRARAASSPRTTPGRRNDRDGAVAPGVAARFVSYMFPHRPQFDLPLPRPSPRERPPPESIQVAVMIAMPSPPPSPSGPTVGPCYVGHTKVGEYEIGVVQIPWPSGDGT